MCIRDSFRISFALAADEPISTIDSVPPTLFFMYAFPSYVLSAISPKSKLDVVGCAPAVAERLNLMFVLRANFGSYVQPLYREFNKKDLQTHIYVL